MIFTLKEVDEFDQILNFNSEEYHGGFKKTDQHPACDFGDPSEFGDLDPEVNLRLNKMDYVNKKNVEILIRIMPLL